MGMSESVVDIYVIRNYCEDVNFINIIVFFFVWIINMKSLIFAV